MDLKNEYENLTAKYIVLEEINMEKLGKWLLGRTRQKKFTRRQEISISIAAITFLNAPYVIKGEKGGKDKYIYRITTAAQLAVFFKEEKKIINARRGVRSDWDKKIMKLQSNCKFSRRVSL